MKSEKILIGLCTFKRPKMLQKCLEAITQLENQDGHQIDCCVVNNDTSPICPEVIEKFTQEASSIKFDFLDCIERGIPQARNMILEYASEKKYDFCLFIDDDEYPDSMWINELLSKQAELDADVVQGNVHNEFEAAPWITAPLLKVAKFSHCGEHICRFISTCNVLIARRFYDTEELALRFDHSFALTGGSDKELFNRAIELHQISTAFEKKAIVYEFVPKERTTLNWFFYRYARVEYNSQMKRISSDGHILARLKQIPTLFKMCFRCFFSILNLPFSLTSKVRFRKRTIKLTRRLGRTWGQLSSFMGLKMNPYKNTTGW
jgi:succinoglycan biosynthesis protein ExoM